MGVACVSNTTVEGINTGDFIASENSRVPVQSPENGLDRLDILHDVPTMVDQDWGVARGTITLRRLSFRPVNSRHRWFRLPVSGLGFLSLQLRGR